MPLAMSRWWKQVAARKILIDHANWPNAIVEHGAISRDIQVVDIVPGNDWSGSGAIRRARTTRLRLPRQLSSMAGPKPACSSAQPRFSLDYALWAPGAPSLRMFNAITYLWSLPAPAERKKAYAAAGVMPPITPHPRSELVLGPAVRSRTAARRGAVWGDLRASIPGWTEGRGTASTGGAMNSAAVFGGPEPRSGSPDGG